MNYKDHCGETKSRIHCGPIWAERRMTEIWMKRGNNTQQRKERDISPVYLLKLRIAMKPVVDARYCGSPHENYYTQVV